MGVDNLSDYYDPRLKDARLARLAANKNFSFRKADIADKDAMLAATGMTAVSEQNEGHGHVASGSLKAREVSSVPS